MASSHTPAQTVSRGIGGHLDGHSLVYDVAIRFAAAPGNPGAAQTAHHRIQRRDEAAGGFFPDKVILDEAVFVGFAVRDNNQTREGQLVL